MATVKTAEEILAHQRDLAHKRQKRYNEKKSLSGFKKVTLTLEPEIIEFLERQGGSRAEAVREILAAAMADEEIDMDELLDEAAKKTAHLD